MPLLRSCYEGYVPEISAEETELGRRMALMCGAEMDEICENGLASLVIE